MSGKVSPPLKEFVKVGDLLRRRLRETEHSTDELAEAAQVPVDYIEALIAGRQRPPLPGRTDLYERMTSFLRLSRNDLANCAIAEREASAPTRTPRPKANVRRLLLELCEPETAKKLEQLRGRQGNAELTEYFQRLLNVVQASVRRALDDQITLRIAAERSGHSYAATRLRVLEFLDATADALTTDDIEKFIRPRVTSWDVDLEVGVLRVVLRAQETPERMRRRVNGRTGVAHAQRKA